MKKGLGNPWGLLKPFNYFSIHQLILKILHILNIKKKRNNSSPSCLATCYFCDLSLSSPLKCLTSVFGMVTGVSILPSPPSSWALTQNRITSFFGKAFDLLVSVRSIHLCTSTPDLSTFSSSRGLSLAIGSLILKGISRLDAFSVYSFHT